MNPFSYKNNFYILLLLLIGLCYSCTKYINPKHEDGKSPKTLITGAYVLLFRNAGFNSTAKAPLFEQTLFGELGLRPRNTVTLALDVPWSHVPTSANWQGTWLTVFTGEFFEWEDPQHHFVLARYFYPMFKAKDNLLTVLKDFDSAITPSQRAETYYLLGLIHYFQHYMFGEGAYDTQSDLLPAIVYFEQGLALKALPYKDNKLISDVGAQAFLARFYYLAGKEQEAMVLANELITSENYAAADELLWRVSMTDDNLLHNTYTGLNIWGNDKVQDTWLIGWAATSEPYYEGNLSKNREDILFYAQLQNQGFRWQRAVLPHVKRENGFIIITKEEVEYIAFGKNLSDEDFRQRHVFNALLNRAVAIKAEGRPPANNCGNLTANCGVHYISPHLKP